ncbi:MAG: hypothetical protein HY261_06770 [Chloroflexi bacterium]|nr:hypothetical protein [Chloroflexota bacterium]
MTLVTKVFQPLAVTSAKGRGMPAVPKIVVPHPLNTIPEDRVRAVATKALPEVIRSLTEPGRDIVEIA